MTHPYGAGQPRRLRRVEPDFAPVEVADSLAQFDRLAVDPGGHVLDVGAEARWEVLDRDDPPISGDPLSASAAVCEFATTGEAGASDPLSPLFVVFWLPQPSPSPVSRPNRPSEIMPLIVFLGDAPGTMLRQSIPGQLGTRNRPTPALIRYRLHVS